VTDELIPDRRGRVLIPHVNHPDARNTLTPEIIRGIGAAFPLDVAVRA
jgi:hypothetical protein